MKKIGLLGKEEIGSSISRIAEDAGYQVVVRELEYDQLKGEEVEALHVCIPYKGPSFIDAVTKAVEDCKCGMLIIHGTTPPGVTKKIGMSVKIPTAHSPVRGNHPDLYDAIKTRFIKYVGGIDEESTKLVVQHLKDLQIEKIEVAPDSLHTELGKMVNIIGYAWSIVFCKWVKQISDQLGVDFDVVYTEFTKSYNEGYKETHPHVIQPVLKAMPGPIGGHCVIPDTVLMDKELPSDLTQFILNHNDQYKKE